MAEVMHSAMDFDMVPKAEENPLLQQIKQLDRKFNLSYRQVLLLNNKIEDLQTRYKRADMDDRESAKYLLQLQITSLEGVRNMFYQYMCSRSDLLDVMHEQLLSEGITDQEMLELTEDGI